MMKGESGVFRSNSLGEFIMHQRMKRQRHEWPFGQNKTDMS